MISLSIKLDPRKIISNYNQLANDFPRATASAINKTAVQALNQGKKEIRDEYNIKAADLNKALTLQRAKTTYLIAKIIGLGRALGIIKFAARQTKTGVSFKIKKSSGRNQIKHAFVAVMKSGHKAVFMRKAKTRLPIEEKYTIGVASMLRAKKIQSKITDYFNANFARIFKHEIEWSLKK